MITLSIGTDGYGTYSDEFGIKTVRGSNDQEIRSLLLGLAVRRARLDGDAVLVTAVDPSGRVHLQVGTDGSLTLVPASMLDSEPSPASAVFPKALNRDPNHCPLPEDTGSHPAPHRQSSQALLPQSSSDTGYDSGPQQIDRPSSSAAPDLNVVDRALQETTDSSISGPPAQHTGRLSSGSLVVKPSTPASRQTFDYVTRPGSGTAISPDQATSSNARQSIQYTRPLKKGTSSLNDHQTQSPRQVSPSVHNEVTPSSFLASTASQGPRPKGWRALASHFGIRVQPSSFERQQWIDERTVAQHWPGPRTIAVLNGKGGAGKTPTAILLASYFARLGSGSVVAADGNVTRGTLGWRTEQGPHSATILDMVPEIDRLMDPAARNGDVAAFTHHQTIDQFDVLRSNPLLLSTEQKLAPIQLDGIQRVLTRYYRMIIWDTGNDEGDALWLQIVSHADQIVIATTTRADHAEAGRILLEGLAARDQRGNQLAHNAVVVVSQADKEERQACALVDGFSNLARTVVTIPYDPAMREQWLRSDNLAPATRAAWLHAAAAVAAGL